MAVQFVHSKLLENIVREEKRSSRRKFSLAPLAEALSANLAAYT